MRHTTGYWRVLLVVGVVSLLFALVFTPVIAQRAAPIWAFCTSGRVEVTFEAWLPNEVLTAQIDGADVGQYTTATDGSGRYQFPPTTGAITLSRANGDVILAGQADCSKPPAGKITEMNQYELILPVGGKATLVATGQDEAGNEILLDIIWIAESGSFTPEGELTGTEEGEFIITAAHIGQASAFSFQMDLIVTPPLASLVINPPEIFAFPGQGVAFNVAATDVNGVLVDVNLAWDTGGAGEIVPVNFFIAGEELGDYVLTGFIPGTDLSATVIVHLTPELASIQITPEIEEIFVGDTQQFDVVGFDANGNEIEVPTPPTWNAEIGIIDATGKYAATKDGAETITAMVDLNAIQGSTHGRRGLAKDKQPIITVEWKFPVLPPPAQPTVDPAYEPEIDAQSAMTTTLDGDPDALPAQTDDQKLETDSDQNTPTESQTESTESGYYYEDDDYCCWCERLVFWQRTVIFISFWTLMWIFFCGLPKWIEKKIPWWSDWRWQVRASIFGIAIVITAVVSFTVCYWW